MIGCCVWHTIQTGPTTTCVKYGEMPATFRQRNIKRRWKTRKARRGGVLMLWKNRVNFADACK